MPEEMTIKDRLIAFAQHFPQSVDASSVLRRALEIAEEEESKRVQLTVPEMRTALKRNYESLQSSNTFTPGQIIRWKAGLRNRRFPKYGDPAIVVGKADTVVLADEDDPTSPYFRERLDMIIGILDRDGDFLCFYVNSHRFEPAQ